ncbi:hypothetical protein GCM10010112_86970 [Actinoplanes lobatus]|uniref:Uncharacterized protein n=1 Tax=Actinoplanes lobatus TaxID=113568 RepID=A0A7W7MFB1_9ACTN|nr:hypothetical protein [Actinoplanes lobatus]MBB4747765.1 hypothetical protein [Actinoplanes lobatus]GGN96065.1 hypothetical protein GCM10010112_86970 [Actinoplanes lobatus]GIE45161.1 hypothetical protein Alo02nite_80590 [Actinoplanes lobatus]
MSILLCESPLCWRDPDTNALQPRPAAPGLLLCWPCRDRLAADLDRLPDICTDLETALMPGSGAGGPVVSGSRERPMPINNTAAYARAEIRPVLVAWIALVIEVRGVRPPRRADDPAVLSRWLRRHVDWLAAYPAAGDAADEIADVRRIAFRGAYPNPVRRVEVGACPFAGCTGTVAAIVRDRSAVLPSSALCDTDTGHEWPMTEWPRLRREMRRAETTPVQGAA